jgi:hypothetical protein
MKKTTEKKSETTTTTPKAPKVPKAKKEHPSSAGLNPFIRKQAALGKSAKEIAQLAHKGKWPQCNPELPGWINGINRLLVAAAKVAEKKAAKAAEKPARAKKVSAPAR